MAPERGAPANDDDLALEQRQSLMRYADRRQDWTVKELAVLYGITPQQVSQIIREHCP